MELKKSEKLEHNQHELTFVIDKETFEAAVTKAFRKNAKNIRVPGFRPGKAPRNVIEKMYGKGVFYEDAINDVLPDAYDAAVKEAGISPVSRPEIDVESVEDGVTVKATVYVKPEVAVQDYKGIEANKYVKPVTDEEVNEEIERVRKRNAREIEITDRPAAVGDKVVIDYCGSVDGEEFEGGKADNYTLELGSNTFIPGFEDQIAGHSCGDSFDVNVTFPEEYHSENLAGKAAVFKTVLHSIKFDELPELDDEFAKDVSEFDTFDAYRDDVRKKAEDRNEHAADHEFEGQLIDALIGKLEGEIPEPMFEQETENFVRDYDMRLRYQGLDLKTYFKYTGLDIDALRKELRPQAERQVKTRLALEKIADLENIAASDEDIDAEYTRLAEAYGMEADKVRETVAKEDVAADLRVQKAVQFLKDNAVVTNNPPEEKKPEEESADA